MALRHYFLASHYRSPMDFSKEGLEEAARAVERLIDTAARGAELVAGTAPVTPDNHLLEAFRNEMDDDFNTPRALALLFDEARALNRLFDRKKTAGLAARVAAYRSLCGTLGVSAEGYADRKNRRWLAQGIITPAEIEALIARRTRAREEKNWAEADRLRNELQSKGILIEDTPGGTVWKVK